MKKVSAHVVGPGCMQASVDRTWDNFFLEEEASGNVVLGRADQGLEHRCEPLH